MSAERELSPAILALIIKEVVRPVLFLFADFPSGAKRIWTGQGDRTFLGETWEGVGQVIGIESVSETLDTAAKGINIVINGVDLPLITMLMQDKYQGRKLTLYLGFWDKDTGTLEMMPGPFWDGTLDTDNISVTRNKANLSVNGEHRLVDILRKKEFRYTHRDQEFLYPGQGDTGMNKIEGLVDKSNPWGRTQA